MLAHWDLRGIPRTLPNDGKAATLDHTSLTVNLILPARLGPESDTDLPPSNTYHLLLKKVLYSN